MTENLVNKVQNFKIYWDVILRNPLDYRIFNDVSVTCGVTQRIDVKIFLLCNHHSLRCLASDLHKFYVQVLHPG